MHLGHETCCHNFITLHICRTCRIDPVFIVNVRSLEKPLDLKNYSKKFGLLLHLEEHQLKKEFKKFNRDNVPLCRHEKNPNIFIMQVMHHTDTHTI